MDAHRYVCMQLRARFLKTLDVAVATLGDVAEGMGRHYRTIQNYRRGERRVTEDAALALVRYLRIRAAELNQAADELETAAQQEEEPDE